MPEFAYVAKDQTGSRLSGVLAAATRHAVLDELARRGLVPLSVDQQQAERRPAAARPRRPAAVRPRRQRSVRALALESFTRELAHLLSGGVPLARALRLVQREASHPVAAAQWRAIHDDVAGGMSLAQAMGRWPATFGPVYLAMVRSGETGGFLDVVLLQVAEFRARERDLVSRVRLAMVYPCILTVLAAGVLVFCLTFFIPRFATIFDQFGGQLPLITRLVVAASGSLATYGLPVAVALGIAVLFLQRALRSDAGRRSAESMMLGTPIVGRIVAHFALVRFCGMLGTLLHAGVPLVAALGVGHAAIGIQTLTDAVVDATDKVKRGAALAPSLATAKRLFAPSVIETIAVAEQSGRLDSELLRVAQTTQVQLDREMRTAVALIEPMLLLVMAALVGTVVLAMLLPVFSIQDLIQ